MKAVYLVLDPKHLPSAGLSADDRAEDIGLPGKRQQLIFPDGEGQRMFQEWYDEPGHTDGTVSGVFADWIEDHPDLWPDQDVEPFVSALRGRFNHPNNNQQR